VPDLVDVFDNREKAVVIWVAAVLIFCLAKRGLRRHFRPLLAALIHPALAGPLVLTSFYVAGVVSGLALAGLWTVSLLGTTIFWYFGAALAAFGRAADAGRDPDYVRRLVRSSVAALLGIEFLVNLYVFPLAVELLLVPSVAFVVMLSVVAEPKPEYAPVRTLVDRVLISFGLFVLIRALVLLALDFERFATSLTLLRFGLPVILRSRFARSCTCLPFTGSMRCSSCGTTS